MLKIQTTSFYSSTGMLRLLRTPKENDVVRVDTGVVEGDEVSVFYDPMIAKLVVWGENREIALKRLISALGDYYIDGKHKHRLLKACRYTPRVRSR